MSNIWDPVIVVDEKLVIEILNEQFPEINITQIKKIDEGFDNTVFKLNDDILLRFPRREIAVSILKIEKKLLPLIYHQFDMNTTVPKLHGTPSKLFPWPYLGYNFISGKYPIHLNREERLSMIEPIANFLRKLHSIQLSELKEINLPYDELRRLDVNYRKPQLQKFVQQAINNKLIIDERKINRYIENLTEINSDTSLVLVHGDLHFKNIIVNDQNKITGIIDWGDAHIGKCELDLAIIYSIIPFDQREGFYEIYGNVSEESKKLAQFRAIYTTILLLLFAYEKKDYPFITFCQENLENALNN